MNELDSTLTTLSFCVFRNCQWNSTQFLSLSGGKQYLHIRNVISPNAMVLQRPQSVQQFALGSWHDFCFTKGWDWCCPISHPTCWQHLLYLFPKSGSFRGSELCHLISQEGNDSFCSMANWQQAALPPTSNRQHPISFGCSTHIIDHKQRQWKNPPLQIAETMFWQLSFFCVSLFPTNNEAASSSGTTTQFKHCRERSKFWGCIHLTILK